jgi:hypothetical protein
MFSETYYLIRSKTDGKYLAARPHEDNSSSYLLLFKEQYEALSYLNTHAGEYASRLNVEFIPGNQISSLLKRWSFIGVGIVSDPLIPNIEFLQHS